MRKLVVTLLAALAVIASALAITAPAQAATPATIPATTQADPTTTPAAAPTTEKTTAAQKAAKEKARKKALAKKRAAAKKRAQLRVWNRLAHCESTSRWFVNTGNGYYGGLQISPSTWRAFGGHRFAGLPHRATKGEQIVVGKRIKNGQGWGAWPSCSRRLGLR